MVDLEVFMLVVDGIDLLIYARVDGSILLLQHQNLPGHYLYLLRLVF